MIILYDELNLYSFKYLCPWSIVAQVECAQLQIIRQVGDESRSWSVTVICWVIMWIIQLHFLLLKKTKQRIGSNWILSWCCSCYFSFSLYLYCIFIKQMHIQREIVMRALCYNTAGKTEHWKMSDRWSNDNFDEQQPLNWFPWQLQSPHCLIKESVPQLSGAYGVQALPH